MPGKITLRPLTAAADDVDVRKKKRPPATLDDAGTGDRLQAALNPSKKPAVDPIDTAIGSFMNDVRAGDSDGATKRLQQFARQNALSGKKGKP